MSKKFISKNTLKNKSYQSTSLAGLPFKSIYPCDCTIKSITKTYLLQTIQDNKLSYPATYNITDIPGFSSVIITTTGSNTISANASGLLLSPDYVASGVNLGQLNANDIQTVADGEKIIWADHYWVNLTGGSIVPTIVDDFTLDAPLIQVSKSVANGYLEVPVEVIISNTLEISVIYYPETASNFKFPSAISTIFGFPPYIYTPISQPYNSSDNVLSTLNNFIENNKVVNIRNSYEDYAVVKNNSALLSGILIEGGGNEITGNISSGKGGFNTIKLVNVSRLQNNETVGSGNDGASIGYVELFDNCEMIGNYLEGDGCVIWDVRTGESSKINNNSVVGNNSGWSDIDQMNNDYVENNTITGDGINIAILDMLGKSVFSNNTFTNPGFHGEAFEMLNSSITNCTISSGVTGWNSIWLTDSTITNATNITLRKLHFSNVYLDLTGFTTDIIGESIEGGKGWFTIEHDFTTSPLTSGSSVLYNLIPISARILNIKAIGLISGGAGATLTLGLETDDASLISDTLGNYSTGKSYSGFSGQATANRSLQLTAGVDNITSGTIKVYVEFIL